MANLIRLPKSGSDWGPGELEAYNIKVCDVTVESFFGLKDLPNLPPTIQCLAELPVPADTRDLSDDTEVKFFRYLLSTQIQHSLESAVDDLAVFLLQLFFGRLLLRTKPGMKLQMGGSSVDAVPDIALFGLHDDVVLLVQENKASDGVPMGKLILTHWVQRNGFNGFSEREKAEAQLIAEAVAAHTRNKTLGETKRDIYGITMLGPTPYFYRIPINEALIKAINESYFPEEPTIVFRFIPPVRNKQIYNAIGLVVPENRKLIFQCLQALQALLVCWSLQWMNNLYMMQILGDGGYWSSRVTVTSVFSASKRNGYLGWRSQISCHIIHGAVEHQRENNRYLWTTNDVLWS